MCALPCSELIDEIQERCGRPNATDLIDATWLTRRINEAQKLIVEGIPLLRSNVFKNTESFDTTGTIKYAIADITVGDDTDKNRPFHITDVWYLDGQDTRRLTYQPVDLFDAEHPDPTHEDMNFEKPAFWTQRGNVYIEMYPYCASSYWDMNLRFDGDYYAADFTTDSTQLSDISRADEGLILYGVWQSWKAIGLSNPSVAAEIINAKKAWTNPNPGAGETIGWLEEFRDMQDQAVAWEQNFYQTAEWGYA